MRRLTERGIEVDANLVRVVRHNARKANQWESRWREAVCREVESRLDSMLALPFSDNVRVTHDELMSFAELVGSGVSENHLLHLARALWVVQYARRTGQSAGTVEAEIARRAQQANEKKQSFKLWVTALNTIKDFCHFVSFRPHAAATSRQRLPSRLTT